MKDFHLLNSHGREKLRLAQQSCTAGSKVHSKSYSTARLCNKLEAKKDNVMEMGNDMNP